MNQISVPPIFGSMNFGPQLQPQARPVAPCGTASFLWHSDRIGASARMQGAVSDLLQHLYPVMRTTNWWDDEQQNRCLWSSAAAAEYLRRRRVRARAVFGAFMIVQVDSQGVPQQGSGLGIGLPDCRTGHPGLHSLVEIADRSGPWLLEMNLWQGRRPRFPGLPDAIAVSRDSDNPSESHPEFNHAGVLPTDRDGHRVYLLVAPGRQRNWCNFGDMETRRARIVADRIEARVRAAADIHPFR